VATREQVCSRIGYPKTIRVDQGSEFISRDMDLWAYRYGVRSTSRGPASQPTRSGHRTE
jgi:putative transposase